MKLIELYNTIKNPLDDEDVLKKIANAYVDSVKDYLPNMQYNLMRSADKMAYFKPAPVDIDRFYSLVFNMWKKGIINLPSDKMDELFKNHEIEADFLDLRFFLIAAPNLTTKEEIDHFFSNEEISEERRKALARYRWDRFARFNYETQICSRGIHFEGDFTDISHALSINAEAMDTYFFATRFIEECESEGLIYYFTFDKNGDDDSTIVIYSSTELLERYIGVLKRMEEKYPNLFERITTPPILSGKIDEKIGYGTFPSWNLHERTPEDSIIDDVYYYEMRSVILDEVCEEESIKWILKNKDRKINSMPLIEAFAFICTLEFLESLKKRAEEEEKKEISAAREQKRRAQIENVIKELGYSKKEVASPAFQSPIYETIRKYILVLLCYVSQRGYRTMPEITMTVRDKKIAFTAILLDKAVKQIIRSYAISDPDFLNQIKEAAKQKAEAYNIDANKFCCEAGSVEEYKMYDAHGPMSRKRISNSDQISE